MSTTNELWLAHNGRLVRLDLDDDTALLPTFQANDRTKPESIQSDYSPEFSAPGTSHNHALLRQAASSAPAQGSAYTRVPCVLTSGGVETLPLGILYLKGFKEGRYQLQLFGGNRRLVEALGEKMLSDLDFARFDHTWTAVHIVARLPINYWQSQGFGYEVLDRGKPVNLNDIDPYTLYPSVAYWLVWQQILADAGFTADSLMAEPLFAALNIPTANAYTFSQEFRDARRLQAGFTYVPQQNGFTQGIAHTSEFVRERIPFAYTARAPYHAPTVGTPYASTTFVAETLGLYDLKATARVYYGCDALAPGQVSCQVMLFVNGQPVIEGGVQVGIDLHRITSNAETDRNSGYMYRAFTPHLDRFKLSPGDTVEVFWQGDEYTTIGPFDPLSPRWQIGQPGPRTVSIGAGLELDAETTFTVTLLEEFPQGGLVKLNEWLPSMKQLDFVKSGMLLLGLTIQADPYEPHLRLATGAQLLANIPRAPNWTAKRDAYAQPGRLPERDLAFRFGPYGQANALKWKADADVTEGYGDGSIAVADEALPTVYELATLPFAASEPSKVVAGLLRVTNYEVTDFTTSPLTYNTVEAQPRLVLRGEAPVLVVKVAGLVISTTASYFAGLDLSLLLNGTVLGTYWADLRAMLDQSRYLVEYYRLTPQDIAALDFSVPIWDSILGDFYAVSAVGEYDDRRPVEVRLCRLNAAYLPGPAVPGGPYEFFAAEFYIPEIY